MAGSVEQDLGMIVESAAEGDEIAFGRIVAAYQDQMYCLCVAVCRHRSLAEEAEVELPADSSERPGGIDPATGIAGIDLRDAMRRLDPDDRQGLG